MMYDYKKGKEDVEKILKNDTEILEKDIPSNDDNFTYGNGIKSWVGSIFVDIVGSTELIKNNDELEVSKILRSFSSEIITIMNSSVNVREIGIRGDCVYGVFFCPTKQSTYELANIAFHINTLVKMLNKLFIQNGYHQIEVGIGVSIGDHKDLIIKAGKKGTGINDKIWIGDAVVNACNIANLAGRNSKERIGFSSNTYANFIDILQKNNPGENVKNWFNYDINDKAYYADIVKTEFNNWINDNI